MAEAFTNALARERGVKVGGISAGTIAGEKINPIAEAVMEEAGVSMGEQMPKQLTREAQWKSAMKGGPAHDTEVLSGLKRS